MNRYVVKRADGTLLVVAAERHRRHDAHVLFEIRTWDQNLPDEQQWRTVTSVAETDVEQITVVRPDAQPPPGTNSAPSPHR